MSDSQIKQNISNNIALLRKQNGMTQTDLAIVLDKKKTTIATWEQCSSMPDVEMLYRIATYYNKTMDYMYRDNSKDA